MNAKILLAGEYTDKVIVKSNFINGDDKCQIIGANTIFSHVEGQDSSTSSSYSHVDGVSSSIGTNSERGHIIGNNSKITDSSNAIIIGQYSNITKSPNSIVLGNASIGTEGNSLENNIVIGSNVKVETGSKNIILGSFTSASSVSPSSENCIYLYTPNGMDDIFINDKRLSEQTNTFGMRNVYATLQENNGISFVTTDNDSIQYTTVSAVSSDAVSYPVFDLHEARKILVKDYSESELANDDSHLYSASIGYVDRKFDVVGINGASLSLSDVTPSYYFIVSLDKTAGSGIYATLNASIVDNSSEYHYNFWFELHYVNDSVGISSDTYILNTNNINLFKNTISVEYIVGDKIDVYIRVLSNTNDQNISLNITVKHTAQSNAIFKKLEKLTDNPTNTTPLSFDKSILQSRGNTFEVDLTSSTRVKAKTVSLSNSIIDSYKNDVVTCGLLKEVNSNVVTLSDSQVVSGNKRFSGECYVKSVDIKTNLNTDKVVSCKSLNQYLTSLGSISDASYVTLGTEQTITGKKTFTGEVTFNNYIYGKNINGLNIVNTSPTAGLRLYGGNGTNGGARLLLDGKGANSKGAWSIIASDGTENKSLSGTTDRLTWGGDRVLTYNTDLVPINEKINDLYNIIGQINSVLEENVGGLTFQSSNNTPTIPPATVEQIFDNTYVYVSDAGFDGSATKTINVTEECAAIGLVVNSYGVSLAVIGSDSGTFLKPWTNYDIGVKIQTISPTNLTLSTTKDLRALSAVALCYIKNIKVERYYINFGLRSPYVGRTNMIKLDKDAVLVLLCGSGISSNGSSNYAYISVNGERIIETRGIGSAHRIIQVEKNTTVHLIVGKIEAWAFAEVFVLTPS